jgi:hypothetical protein
MIKRTLAATAVAALLMTPAIAQTQTTTTGAFMQNQGQNQWLGSDLIGAKVVNNANETIGEIEDILVDQNGTVHAAVIGVGGFLGVGEKDVAVSFKELKITRDQNDGDIDKVTVNYNKDQLKSAPEFKSAADQRANRSNTTGSGGTNNNNRTTNTNR